MKAALLCILVLTATAVEFETFQEALDFDPQSLSDPNCGNDDSFTQQYESFFPWIQLIEEGEVEMQEDHSVLTQARDKIKEVREYIQGLDQDIEQEKAAEPTYPQPTTTTTEEQPAPAPEPQQPTQPEPVEDDDDDEDDDPFGWGQGEVPQMLIHSKKQKQNGHAKVLLEVMNGSKSLKFKSKIRKLIAMATSLDTDMGTADVTERKHRKLELCDLILEELNNMIEFLEKVMNDIDYQIEALDIFRKKQEEIVEVATECGARVISLQDTYSVSFVETQPLKRNKKHSKKAKHSKKH